MRFGPFLIIRLQCGGKRHEKTDDGVGVWAKQDMAQAERRALATILDFDTIRPERERETVEASCHPDSG